MQITKTATIKINEDEASQIFYGLLARIKELKSCKCDDCLNATVEVRAKKILDLYFIAYDFSKIPRHGVIKVPSLNDIEEEITNNL